MISSASTKNNKKNCFILLSIAAALKLPVFIPQADFFQIYPPRKVFSEERGETGGNLRGASELRTRNWETGSGEERRLEMAHFLLVWKEAWRD